jgi:hypothetical protein
MGGVWGNHSEQENDHHDKMHSQTFDFEWCGNVFLLCALIFVMCVFVLGAVKVDVEPHALVWLLYEIAYESYDSQNISQWQQWCTVGNDHLQTGCMPA